MKMPREEWIALVRRYEREREENERLTQASFAQAAGLSVHTFRKWVSKVGAGPRPRTNTTSAALPAQVDLKRKLTADGVPYAPGLVVVDHKNPRAKVALNPTDLRIIKDLGHDRCNSLSLIASRHFSLSADPLNSAAMRLRKLEAAGHVRIDRRRDPVVYLTPSGAREVGAAYPRNMHRNHITHHIATLKAIDAYRTRIEAKGGVLVPFELRNGREAPYMLEIHIQSEERRFKTSGTTYDASPDGLLKVKMPGQAMQTVAVEYYTRAYSDEQIASKIKLQNQCDHVMQVADSAVTAGRVQGITGVACWA